MTELGYHELGLRYLDQALHSEGVFDLQDAAEDMKRSADYYAETKNISEPHPGYELLCIILAGRHHALSKLPGRKKEADLMSLAVASVTPLAKAARARNLSNAATSWRQYRSEMESITNQARNYGIELTDSTPQSDWGLSAMAGAMASVNDSIAILDRRKVQPTPRDLRRTPLQQEQAKEALKKRAKTPRLSPPTRKPSRITIPTPSQTQPKSRRIELRWFFFTHSARTGPPGASRPAQHLWYSRPFDYHRPVAEWAELDIVKKRSLSERSIKMLAAEDYRQFIEAARPKYAEWVYGPVLDSTGGAPIPSSLPGSAALHGPYKTLPEAEAAIQAITSQPAYNRHVEATKTHKLSWERNESNRTER